MRRSKEARTVATTIDKWFSGFLGDWEPSATCVRELNRLYAGALNERVGRRCSELLARSPDRSTAARLQPLLPSLAASEWTTPSLAFALFVQLAESSRATKERVRLAVDELERVVDGGPPSLEVSPQGHPPAWVDYALPILARDKPGGGGGPVGLEVVIPGDEAVAACLDALDLLETAWPEMAVTVNVLMRELRWLEGTNPMRSATLTQTFGAVFLRNGLARMRLYEVLVHEATHLELVARMALDRLLENRSDRAPSPFKSDARPLTRVLHATFVAARLVTALERCQSHVSKEEGELARRWQSRFASSRDDGLRTLAEHAEWTATGRELFNAMQAETVDRPDARTITNRD
jgi:HEXXH motif-containing protein